MSHGVNNSRLQITPLKNYMAKWHCSIWCAPCAYNITCWTHVKDADVFQLSMGVHPFCSTVPPHFNSTYVIIWRHTTVDHYSSLKACPLLMFSWNLSHLTVPYICVVMATLYNTKMVTACRFVVVEHTNTLANIRRDTCMTQSNATPLMHIIIH